MIYNLELECSRLFQQFWNTTQLRQHWQRVCQWCFTTVLDPFLHQCVCAEVKVEVVIALKLEDISTLKTNIFSSHQVKYHPFVTPFGHRQWRVCSDSKMPMCKDFLPQSLTKYMICLVKRLDWLGWGNKSTWLDLEKKITRLFKTHRISCRGCVRQWGTWWSISAWHTGNETWL